MVDAYYPGLLVIYGIHIDLMPLVALWFMSHEVVSVLEHLGSMGAPVPMGLVKRLKQVNESVDQKLSGESKKR